MKLFAALLSLVATASAIDLYKFGDYNCNGNWIRCTNVNPNACCIGAGGFSVSAMGIPSGWNIELRGHTGGSCNSGQSTTPNSGHSWVCLNGGYYFGTSYRFFGRKRDEPVVDSECQRPDLLGLADGTKYNLTSLNDVEFDMLSPFGLDATSAKDVPEELKPLQIN